MRNSVRVTIRRTVAVLTSLGTIVALAMAGGASFRGW
jgi:hypothetical protein